MREQAESLPSVYRFFSGLKRGGVLVFLGWLSFSGF